MQCLQEIQEMSSTNKKNPKSAKKVYAKRQPKATVVSNPNEATYLVIVESPSKCAKIESYLGPQYQCIASKGHIREITGLKDIDVKNNYTPKFSIIKEKSEHVNWMRSMIELYQKDRVLVATDDDREGEGIAWHIYQLFDLPTTVDNRIVFHEITQPAIQEAIRSPRRLDMQLVKAQQARQVLDVIVGFKVSPLLWKHIQQGKKGAALSAGRCQTPALRLIYDNEKICRDSEPELLYKTRGHFSGRALDFVLNHDFEKVEDMEGFLKESAGFQHILDIGPEKSSIKKAPKPFNTSRLLQVASSLLKSSPKQTMQTCQELYQNGYITYMRTENTKYSPIFLDQAKKYIETVYQDIRYIGVLDSIENKDANNPHEAIRCTNVSLRELPADVNPKLVSMYALIWRNTVESCMSDAQYKTQCASVSAPQKHTYQRILEIPVFLGWKKVGLERGVPLGSDKKPLGSDKKPLDDDSATLFYLQSQKDATMSYTHIESKIQIRGKKTHYTESGLIQELEELGIGRPSTFSLLVDTVQDRGYVKCQDIPGIEKECTEFILQSSGVLDKQVVKKELGGEKQKLRIQPVGILCIEFLIEHFGCIFSYDYTKLMEEQLDSIAKERDSTTSSHSICLSCDQTIDTLSKILCTMKRQEIAIDASNVFVMTRQGPAIRSNEGVYASINPDLNLDIDKLKRGEYTLDSLVADKCRELGVYQDSTLYLKTGKYGPYLEWCKGSKKQSTRTLVSTTTDKITLEIATDFLDKQQESTAHEGSNKRDAPTAATSILRAINTDASVRQGKFGPYIFYKTESMKKPQFVPLRGFKGEWKTCSPNTLLQWIQDSIGKPKTNK